MKTGNTLKNISPKIFENLWLVKIRTLWGDDSNNGSAIIFAIRDILLRKHIDVIESYSQVILTRSDYIYVNYHQILIKKIFGHLKVKIILE